uniref:Uncharacterized protein n=1 Tax=Rhizophora mucronata TaxID=61149 RepID=A0A2P2NUG5_RHIMU
MNESRTTHTRSKNFHKNKKEGIKAKGPREGEHSDRTADQFVVFVRLSLWVCLSMSK